MSSHSDFNTILHTTASHNIAADPSRSADCYFRIVHRFRMPGSICLPGEEVFAIFLVDRQREYQLRLNLALRILFDFLARHSRIAQSARQIELGIRADDFYMEHAKNGKCRHGLVRRVPRSTVREYIKRLHLALSVLFHEANLSIDPGTVLIVWETVGNEVLYQLKMPCRWTHIDLTARDSRPIWK